MPLRRIAAEVSPLARVNALAPTRVARNKMTGPNEHEQQPARCIDQRLPHPDV